MSGYVPTSDEVRQRYKAGAWLKGDRNPDQFNPSEYEPIYFAEFDRWLAEVERAAAEKAWDECDDAITAALVREGELSATVFNAWPTNPFGAAALGLTTEQEGDDRG